MRSASSISTSVRAEISAAVSARVAMPRMSRSTMRTYSRRLKRASRREVSVSKERELKRAKSRRTPRPTACARARLHGRSPAAGRGSGSEFRPGIGCCRTARERNAEVADAAPGTGPGHSGPGLRSVPTCSARHPDWASPPAGVTSPGIRTKAAARQLARDWPAPARAPESRWRQNSLHRTRRLRAQSRLLRPPPPLTVVGLPSSSLLES